MELLIPIALNAMILFVTVVSLTLSSEILPRETASYASIGSRAVQLVLIKPTVILAMMNTHILIQLAHLRELALSNATIRA